MPSIQMEKPTHVLISLLLSPFLAIAIQTLPYHVHIFRGEMSQCAHTVLYLRRLRYNPLQYVLPHGFSGNTQFRSGVHRCGICLAPHYYHKHLKVRLVCPTPIIPMERRYHTFRTMSTIIMLLEYSLNLWQVTQSANANLRSYPVLFTFPA